MIRFIALVLLMFSTLFFVNRSAMAESDGTFCSAFLQSDAQMFNSLPERVRKILQSPRTVQWALNREEAWGPFLRSLDQGVVNLYQSFDTQIDDLKLTMRFTRQADGILQLEIEFARRLGLSIGETSASGFRFLDLIAAQLTWFARYRARTGAEEFEIIGQGLQNKKLASFLRTIGFESKSKLMTTSDFWAIGQFALFLGGIGTGATLIIIPSPTLPQALEIGSALTLLSGAAFGSFVKWGSGKDFVLRVAPGRLPSSID